MPERPDSARAPVRTTRYRGCPLTVSRAQERFPPASRVLGQWRDCIEHGTVGAATLLFDGLNAR